jgi:hypothetical protein
MGTRAGCRLAPEVVKRGLWLRMFCGCACKDRTLNLSQGLDGRAWLRIPMVGGGVGASQVLRAQKIRPSEDLCYLPCPLQVLLSHPMARRMLLTAAAVISAAVTQAFVPLGQTTWMQQMGRQGQTARAMRRGGERAAAPITREAEGAWC